MIIIWILIETFLIIERYNQVSLKSRRLLKLIMYDEKVLFFKNEPKNGFE